MYNVSKGPSKLVTQTRRGISQHLERLENRKDNTKKSQESLTEKETSVPKPIFHSNGYLKRNHLNNCNRGKEVISPQHAEIIRFINESWKNVHSQYEQYSPASSPGSNYSTNSTQSVIYYEEEPRESIQNFQPFDLESWWSKRLYNKITKSL
ncbi:MAPK regulated corepressor interacting protein 2 [Chrysoperla carnea]|uniref:MAPK regulated corepressor interacting protein 2 n=1 Tax=Chrysoperla carnea TaxID=189513 RepID=UPI001D06F5D8|nr:MAPK regulated corepressor interacting protein 2 [Chrysoperla carnea]